MHLPAYLTLLSSAGQTQANSYRQVAVGHAGEPDVRYICEDFARQCAAHAEALAPIVVRYADRRQDEPDRLHPAGLTSPRSGPAGLLVPSLTVDRVGLAPARAIMPFMGCSPVVSALAGRSMRARPSPSEDRALSGAALPGRGPAPSERIMSP